MALAKNLAKKNNIEELEQVVIKSKDPKWCYKFACNVEGANIEKLEQAVVESNDPIWCYKFIIYVKNANIKKLEQVVMNDENYCSENKTSSSIKEIKQKILSLKN